RYAFPAKAYLNAPAMAGGSTAAGQPPARSDPPCRTRGRPRSPAAAPPRSGRRRGRGPGPRTAGMAARGPAAPACAAWTGRRSRTRAPAVRHDEPEPQVGRLAAVGARLRLGDGLGALDLEDQPCRALAAAEAARAPLVGLPLQRPH